MMPHIKDKIAPPPCLLFLHWLSVLGWGRERFLLPKPRKPFPNVNRQDLPPAPGQGWKGTEDGEMVPVLENAQGCCPKAHARGASCRKLPVSAGRLPSCTGSLDLLC